MKIEYDPKHDILDIELVSEVAIEDSVEFDGVILDYASGKRLASVEILDASKRTSPHLLDVLNVAVVREKV